MKLSFFEEVAALFSSATVLPAITLRTFTLTDSKPMHDPMKDPSHGYASIHCAIGYIISNSYSAEKPKGMR